MTISRVTRRARGSSDVLGARPTIPAPAPGPPSGAPAGRLGARPLAQGGAELVHALSRHDDAPRVGEPHPHRRDRRQDQGQEGQAAPAVGPHAGLQVGGRARPGQQPEPLAHREGGPLLGGHEAQVPVGDNAEQVALGVEW